MLIQFMTIEQTLLQEIEESKRWFNLEKDENTYKREVAKRIELINGVLENMKNPNIKICNLIESKMNEIILKINQTYTIFKADKLYTELRVLDWIILLISRSLIK
jgi:tRNA U54 and U55 pseudouridine synthase Pus10